MKKGHHHYSADTHQIDEDDIADMCIGNKSSVGTRGQTVVNHGRGHLHTDNTQHRPNIVQCNSLQELMYLIS
jgi:hypothetical protein